MAAQNINVVVVDGNLTRDPELRTLANDFSICSLRIAVNTRKKENGEWTDYANYFDVTVFGKQGENCAKFLKKGSAITVHGRLEWREWEAKDGSGKRQAVQIIAESVRFGARAGEGNGSAAAASSAPVDEPASAPAGDDDLPF